MTDEQIIEMAKSEQLRGKATREEFLITFARLIAAKQREADARIAEIERLRKIEAAAVDVVMAPTWSGDDFYNLVCHLDVALRGE